MVRSRGKQLRAPSVSEYCSIKEKVLKQRNNMSLYNRSYVPAAGCGRPLGPDHALFERSSLEIFPTQTRESLGP